jgi:hypothetical protein
VNAKGHVTSEEVTKGAGDLQRAAVQMVESWNFKPLIEGTTPIRWAALVRFELWKQPGGSAEFGQSGLTLRWKFIDPAEDDSVHPGHASTVSK